MGPAPSKDDYDFRYDSAPSSPASSLHSHHGSRGSDHARQHDIPHDKRLAKRQIEVYYRDFFMLYHDRGHEMARIDSAARSGHIDEDTRRKLRKEQFLRELEYIRKRRNPMSTAHYEIIRKIGQGSFGEVFLVRHRGDRQLYAMKKLQKKDMIYKRQVNHVWLERFVLASVGEHPLVVKMHYSFQDQDHLYFIMEYLHGGDMMTMLIRNDYLQEEWARFYIAELVVAIDALHRTGIIHRDIKPDNILFRKNGHICLSDFGLSKSLMQPSERDWIALTGAAYVNAPNFIEHIRRGDVDLPLKDRVKLWKALAKEYAFSQVGTPNYIAPEVLQDHSYSESCDWWSVGVILYEMLVGCPPFCARNPAHVTGMICQWRRYLHFPRDLPESRMSRAAEDLICRLICESQSRLGGKRGLEEFKEHPFFDGIDWDNLSHAKAPFIPELASDTDTRYFEEEITKADVSQVIPQQPQAREEAITSCATSTSSGSGKDETSAKPPKLPRRRSSRKIKYDRNRDLEFVGFTFIPMRLERDQWRSRQDLYNTPSTTRAEQKPSAMTEALSLEGDPAEAQAKPLRSPRGRVAEAAIAAAEVTSEEMDVTRPLPWGENGEEQNVPNNLQRTGGGNLRVRFKDTTNAYESSRGPNDRIETIVSEDAAVAGADRRSLGEERLARDPSTMQVEEPGGRVPYDDLDDGLGAVRVTEVEVPPATDMWEEGQSEPQDIPTRQAEVVPNLHTCLSMPELRTKNTAQLADSMITPSDAEQIQRKISRLEPDQCRTVAVRKDGVERRTSELHSPRVALQYREEALSQAVTVSEDDTLTLPPTPSEVDIFVDVASREIHSAARELTNMPNSNVPAVIRHAKEDLNGTAVSMQESYVPETSTSTASEETSEFPEGTPEVHVR